MTDPAKEPANWTEHTHSDGRRYYYNKAGSIALIRHACLMSTPWSPSKRCLFVILAMWWHVLPIPAHHYYMNIVKFILAMCCIFSSYCQSNYAERVRDSNIVCNPSWQTHHLKATYFSQVTKASSWDKPECLKNADEKLNTTSWKEHLCRTRSNIQRSPQLGNRWGSRLELKVELTLPVVLS